MKNLRVLRVELLDSITIPGLNPVTALNAKQVEKLEFINTQWLMITTKKGSSALVSAANIKSVSLDVQK